MKSICTGIRSPVSLGARTHLIFRVKEKKEEEGREGRREGSKEEKKEGGKEGRQGRREGAAEIISRQNCLHKLINISTEYFIYHKSNASVTTSEDHKAEVQHFTEEMMRYQEKKKQAPLENRRGKVHSSRGSSC